jgi:hypothetical protein
MKRSFAGTNANQQMGTWGIDICTDYKHVVEKELAELLDARISD